MNNEAALFEQTILPHLDAAYNLARWLAGNEHDARDVVQESFLRAFKFFDRYRGGDARSWLSLAWGGSRTKDCSGGARRTCTAR